jgi:hypothetical protein
MGETPTDQRYQFKIVLREVSPLIWRRVVVPSTITLAELHEVIQVAMGWEDEHLHRFHVHGQDHGLAKTGTAGFGRPRQLRLLDLRLRVGERFRYEYNFHAPWQHDLRLEAKLEADPRRPWPVCTGGRRACPPEPCYGPDAYQRWLATRCSFEALCALEEAGDAVVAIVARKLETDELLTEEERDQLQEAAWVLGDYVESDPERFDRKVVNQTLKEWWRALCSSGSS